MRTHDATLPQAIAPDRTDQALPATVEAVPEPQHTLLQSVILHLGPGVLIFAFYVLTAPSIMRRGLPAMFASLLAILFVAIPVELGELLRRGRRYNGRLSLKGVVQYRQPLRWWQYPLIVVGFLLIALLISGATGVLDTVLAKWLSRALPPWFFLNDFAQYAQYSRNALIFTLTVNLVLNGTIGPIVEELYFRGYLLPRLSRFGVWAPLINTALFTIYHFWQPYAYLSIIAVITPMVYLVWWKRNVYLAIALHAALNIGGNLLLFGALLNRAA